MPSNAGFVSPSVPADAPVTWIGARPVDEEPHVVWHVLTVERVHGYAALVDRVAERLFRRDMERWGGLADVGFFRSLYVAHARALVRRFDGSLLRIGTGGTS